MRIWQQIAVFMAFLVIMFPVISAQAMAAYNVEVYQYSGSDNIEGFMSGDNDYLFVDVDVEYGEYTETTDNETNETTTELEEFNENYLHMIFNNKEELFDSCENVQDNYYTCTYTSDSADRSPDEYDLTVKLYSDQGIVVDQEEFEVYVDGDEPEVTELEVDAYLTGDFDIDYELEDYACSSCNFCVGLKKFKVYIDETMIGEALISGTETDENTTVYDTTEPICEYDDTIETSVNDLGLSEGESELCFVVYDRLGFESEKCIDIIVDTEGPDFNTASFLFTDSNGNNIDYTGDEQIEAIISINITDDVSGLDTSTVIADFSELNTVVPAQYEDYEATSCESDDGIYTCEWQNVFLDGINGSVEIEINATDLAGNTQEFSATLNLGNDNEAPIVTSIQSLFGDYMNAKNNTIMFEIQETGAGFDSLQVYADMSDLGLSSQYQTDECINSGTIWYCYWYDFAAGSSAYDGELVDVKIYNIVDDAGNYYDTVNSEDRGRFTYDGEEPEFINITIAPLGKDIGVLIDQDIAEITAYIYDKYSGVDEDTVFADYSDFDDAEEWAQADSCEEINDSTYECIWEYSGQLFEGDVELNIVAYDLAGNYKDSEDDNEYGEAEIVEEDEQDVDYWEDEAIVEDVPTLNPNFIRQSSTGTVIKLDTELDPTGSTPYVHAYEIAGCVGAIDVPDSTEYDTDYTEFPLVGQYYYPDEDRDKKYLLINVPPLLSSVGVNETLETEGGMVYVLCFAEVIQSKSSSGDIYVPYEQVNISVEVELASGLFQEPSLTTIDKLQKHEEFINKLEKINGFLSKWVEWGNKICGPINAIRSTVNNLAAMIDAIALLFNCPAPPCPSAISSAQTLLNNISKFIDKFWMGKASDGETKPVPGSRYSLVSLGYACDTVLCENCGTLWRTKIFGIEAGQQNIVETGLNSILGFMYKGGAAIGSAAPKGDTVAEGANYDIDAPDTDQAYQAGEYVAGLSGEALMTSLDPRENLAVAIICSPPCVTGIYYRLMVYQQIYTAYNVCLNVAVLKGEDIAQCDEFLAGQICQQVLGAWFWHWIEPLMSMFVAKGIVYTAEKMLEYAINCPNGGDISTPTCKIYRSMDAIGAIVTSALDLRDTWIQFNSTFSKWFEDENATEEELQEEVEQDLDDYIEEQTGSSPEY